MNKAISPSLICMDLCNLANGVKELEAAGCEMLHIDLLDGYFSPSMPIGLEVIRQLRAATNLYFDAHVMAKENTFFMEQLADIGMGRMCFQIETEVHISKKLSWLRSLGIEAGVALAPATPIVGLEYILEQCDFITLMMINPGFASDHSEGVQEGCKRKIADLRKMIEKQGLSTTITIDGRTYLEVIPEYVSLGATTFVAGTSSLFLNNRLSLAANFESLNEVIKTELSREDRR